jgi:hypothetical protein
MPIRNTKWKDILGHPADEPERVYPDELHDTRLPIDDRIHQLGRVPIASSVNVAKNSTRQGRFSIAVRSHSRASDIRRRSIGLGTSTVVMNCHPEGTYECVYKPSELRCVFKGARQCDAALAACDTSLSAPRGILAPSTGSP